MAIHYLAGAMRGFPELNFPAFIEAAKRLRDYDIEVISPHELGDNLNETRSVLMGEDLLTILNDCDAVICLPGWEKSPGACAEVATAFATSKPVFDLELRDNGDLALHPSKTVSVTVPREEQYRQKTRLLGLCGYAQSGKDTVAQYLVGQERNPWTRVAFADKLRDMLYALNPLIEVEWGDVYEFGKAEPVDRLYRQVRVKEIIDEHGWDMAKVAYDEIRQLLQRLGTEAGRECINDNLWVGLAEEKIELAGMPVVVTDCRFQNELHMIRRRGGTLVWIERDGIGAVNGHASEHSVTKDDCDYTLPNSGTLDDLYEMTERVLDLQTVDLILGKAS